MRPTSYPVQFDRLQRIWREFVETGNVNGHHEEAVDPIIMQSWQRCAPLINPTGKPRHTTLTGTALASIKKAQAGLLTIAIPYMEDIHQFMEGAEAAILLADGTGCVLAVEGDAEAQRVVQEYNLGEGAFWSEGYLGTNAFGVALITAMPVQVVGAEHYFERYHQFTSTAAPIHDINGRIIGIIGIVTTIDKSTTHTLSLVMAVAHAITNQLQANLYLEEANHRMMELNTILESINEGVIAWNAAGKINHVNAQAGELLGISPTSVMGHPLTEVIQLPPIVEQAVKDGVELHDAEVSFEVNGHDRTIDAMVSLRALRHGEHLVGYMAMMRPIEQVRRIVHQQVGSKATLKLEDVFSVSPTMRPVLRQARIAARGKAPVLLRGEGGVGKNHLARAIHNASTRADKPFLSINCRAIPRELLVSEFLGFEKDATHGDRPSKFELANGGTLLLDRIESLSLETQSALLQVIETGTVMRLGSTRPIPVDVRVIAATMENLEDLVAEGNFVSHLYYRFGVFNFEMPPLRERTEDIPLLAEKFLARLTERHKSDYWLDEKTLGVLCRYPWPGNVRELEMVLERAIHQSQNGRIRVMDLPEVVRSGRVVTQQSPRPQPVLTAAEAEREAIIRAGWACQGRVTKMAEELKIGRTTLWRKMKRYNIDPDHFKQA